MDRFATWMNKQKSTIYLTLSFVATWRHARLFLTDATRADAVMKKIQRGKKAQRLHSNFLH